MNGMTTQMEKEFECVLSTKKNCSESHSNIMGFIEGVEWAVEYTNRNTTVNKPPSINTLRLDFRNAIKVAGGGAAGGYVPKTKSVKTRSLIQETIKNYQSAIIEAAKDGDIDGVLQLSNECMKFLQALEK